VLKEKKFTHVQAIERDNIAIFKAQNKSGRQIAKELQRSPSTISRELKRGITCKEHYFSTASQSVVDEKKRNARRKRKTDNPEVQKYIIEKINLPYLWSPEIISAKMKEELGISVGKDSIYTFIYKEKPELTEYLTRQHPGKKTRNKDKKTDRTLIPNRTGIEERPEEANERKEFGHFEADTIVSRASLVCLLVIAD
jgi:IS30 family transposase